MATPQVKFDAAAFVDELEALPADQQTGKFETLDSKSKKRQVNKEVNARRVAREAAEKGLVDESDDESVEFTPAGTSAGPAIAKGKGKAVEPTSAHDIPEAEVADMWNAVDMMDVSTIDADALRIFEYQGFNPDLILASFMARAKANSVSRDDMIADIMTLCGLAVIKGTVNENNFKKMKKEGQDRFLELEARYSLKRGGGKGEPADVLTVSRVASAFPGKVVQLVQAGKVKTREFRGRCKSNKLPSLMRTQALAACIPETLKEQTKDYLLGLITAFSIDQSVVIAGKRKPKPTAEDVALDQQNFIRVAHDSKYPREPVRKTIFKQYDWATYYNDTLETAKAYQVINPDFKLIERAQYLADLNEL